MTKSIIVDIDGTLSNPNHRRHLVEGEDKDWEKFFSKVDEDPINEWCKTLVTSIKCSMYQPVEIKVILVTGRPEISKDGVNVYRKTVEWLDEHNLGNMYDELVMRPKGDFRKDTVVKQEILDEQLPDADSILFAVDDRKDIAKMWRENGITCLQCKDEVEDK